MFIIYGLVVGIAAGYLTGGSFRNLSGRTLRWKWAVLAGFLIQITIFSEIPLVKRIPSEITTTLHILSYLCILCFIAANLKIAGIAVAGGGILCNAAAIISNGGYMPAVVSNIGKTAVSGITDSLAHGQAVNNSVAMSDKTVLTWFCDIFYLPSWMPLSNIFSIGDILIFIGVIIYFAFNMRRPAENVTSG